MTVTKVPSAGIDQTTNFAFTGTVTGASDIALLKTVTVSTSVSAVEF